MDSSLKLTVIVDNTAGEGLLAEHGFSMWITFGNRRILFDTGQGLALVKNAEALGVNLEQTNIMVLSHGHYDHTGGIYDLLGHAPQIDIYCHPGAVLPRYVIRNHNCKAIQMPKESVIAINSAVESRVHWVSSGPMRLDDRSGLTGPIPRLTDFEDTGGPFFLDPQGNRPDNIDDDQALWISTDEGLVVCSGCCHAGLINTLDYICQLTGTSKIRAIVGGLHLLNADDRRLELTIASLKLFSPEFIVPCHCTGERATEFLRCAFGNRVLDGHSGMILNF